MKTKKCSLSIITLIALSLILTTSPCRAYFGENSSQAPSGHSMAAIIAGSAIAGIAGLALAFGNFFGKNNPSKDAVTYDSNGASSGKAPVDTSTYDDGATPKVLDNSGNLEKDGSQLLGWSDTPNATVAQYTAGQTIDSLSGSKALYAVYGASITYKNTVSDTTGAPPIDSNKYTAGSPVTVLGSGALVKNNYYFQGWSETDTQKPVTYYKEGSIITMPAKDLTLYAVWSQKPYSVTYDANGAEGSVPAGIIYYNINEKAIVLGNIATPSLSKAGFHFSGWGTTASATAAQYQPGASISMQSSVTLYAIWTCNVLYNSNGGTGNVTDSMNYTLNANATIMSGSNLTNISGYFNNWRSSANVSYLPNQTVAMQGDLNLFAQWNQKPYHVTYDNNTATNNGQVTGTTPIDPLYYNSNDNVTIKWNNASDPMQNPGFTFSGWSNNPGAISPQYNSANNTTILSNLTLYAVWLSNITYNANGGSGALPVNNASYTYNSIATLDNGTGLTKPNYYLGGWQDDNSSTKPTYTLGQQINMTKSLYLTAYWVPNNLTIKYDENGGAGVAPTDDKLYGIGSNATVLNNTLGVTPPRSGFNFSGWSTTANSTAAQYQPGSNITIQNSTTTLHAIWTCNVLYNANGGNGTITGNVTDYMNYTYNAMATILPSGNLTNSNGYFNVWSNNSSSVMGNYTPGNSVNMTGNLNLFAIWTSKPYSVTYYANNATGRVTGNPPTDLGRYDSNTNATIFGNNASTPLANPGFIFSGWSIDPAASSPQYTGNNSTTLLGNLDLYAVWLSNITYSVNGGSGTLPVNNASYTYNSIATLDNGTGLTKPNYSLSGWKNDNTSVRYDLNEKIIMNGSLYLTANWTANLYGITYNDNGTVKAANGKVPLDGKSYNFGDNATILNSNSPLVKPGYVFMGWSTQNQTISPMQVQYSSTSSYNGSNNATFGYDNISLNAVWGGNLTYNANGATGSVPQDNDTYPIDSNATAKPQGNLTKPNNYFHGWSTSGNSSNSSNTYLPGNPVPINGSTTLYAVWNNISWSVIYDGNMENSTYNYGVPPADSNKYNANSTTKVLDNIGNGSNYWLVRTGYNFSGWGIANNSIVNGTGYYAPGDNITLGDSSTTLYAVWRPNQITYNGTGGTVTLPAFAPNDPVIHTNNTNVILQNNTFIRNSFAFQGWDLFSNATNATYQPNNTNSSFNFTYDIHHNNTGKYDFYAIWGYNITYNGDNATNGTAPSDLRVYVPGATAIIMNQSSLNYTSYNFNNWVDASNSSITYNISDVVTMNGSLNLNANWTRKPYNVTYYPNNATNGSAPIDPNYYNGNDPVIILNNTQSTPMSKPGFNFVGWNIDPAASFALAQYKPGNTTSLLNSTGLYAIWTCNITYDANGTAFSDNNTYIDGSTAVLNNGTNNGIKLTKPNYHIDGWQDDNSSTKPTYNLSQRIDHMTGNLYLTAHWAINRYGMKYSDNGTVKATNGTVPEDNTLYNTGDNATIIDSNSPLVKPGYVFMGWSNQTTPPMQVQYSSTSSYNGSNNATFGYSDINLNAVWGGRLTYNASGATGSVPQDNDTYPIGSNAIAKGNSGNLTKDPLYFRGWSKSPSPDLKDLDFLPGEPVPMNGSVTIYAVWDPSSLSVEYNGNTNDYGIAPLDKNSYQADDNAIVLNNTGRGFEGGPLISIDNHFSGWNTLPNGTGDSYQPGSNITLGRNNSTLYAIWSPNQIQYNGNEYTNLSGMQPNDPTVFDANDTNTNVILQGNTFIKTYRTFQGWDENENATDAFYKPNGTFNITYSIYHAGERGAGTYDFYAIWGAMVTYDPNGASSGTPPIDPNIHGINASVAVLPNSGNLIGPGGVPFMGWATNADGTGELNSTFNITKNTTLYANWIGGSYGGGEVIYIGNGTNDITDPRKILIMAKADQSDSMMWAARNGQVDYTKTSAYFGLISNDSSGTIGSGGNNTNIITTLLPNDVSAAKVCHDYRNPGEGTVQYTDWYLPSQWELNAMYIYAKNGTTSGCNVSNGSRGGFKCIAYWSSTELNDHGGINVWSQSFFLDSGQFYYSKTYNIPRVRAVRAVPY